MKPNIGGIVRGAGKMIDTLETTDPELDALLKVYVDQGHNEKFSVFPTGYVDKRCWPVHRFVTVSLGVGRNDQCPCGSGKKFKKCCGE